MTGGPPAQDTPRLNTDLRVIHAGTTSDFAPSRLG